MNPTTMAIGFITTLIAFVALDATWLTLYAFEMFKRDIGSLLRPQPFLGVVGAFYAIYAAVLTALAVLPSVVERSTSAALWRGALFGFGAYATYDLTNYATLQAWTLGITVKDLAWGTIASALASAAGTVATLRLTQRTA